MRRLAAILAALLLASPASALFRRRDPNRPKDPPPHEGAPEDDRGAPTLLVPDTRLIDVPNAGVVDVGGFGSRTRFFSRGGVLQWLEFGVYPRLNLGASLNMDGLIGTDSPVRLTRPDLQIKYRFFDGSRFIPAFAIGFDGQGYLYNRTIRRYSQRQRGLYVVGSQEIGLPGLQAHAGMNISDFDSDDVGGFFASSFNIEDKLELLVEWDNVNDFRDSRFNAGTRVFVTPHFHIGFSVRGIGQGGHYSNGLRRGHERVIQLRYAGSF